MEWPRCSGNPLARLLGVLHNKFRVLDRHQPRGNADLGNPATRECDLAAAGDAVRRDHHRLRSDDRSDVPDHSSWAAVAFLLAHPVSERTANLAEPAIAAGLGLLPDFALLRDQMRGWRKRIYAVLALGWQGTTKQWHRLEAAMQIMAIAIVPVAVSVHTIVSFDFSMSSVPMWHSTVFGPYFVAGAIFSGIAALILAMAVLRKALHLEEYLHPVHFQNLGKLLLMMSLLWGYFTYAERLTTWYGNNSAEMAVFWETQTGAYAPLFWTM